MFPLLGKVSLPNYEYRILLLLTVGKMQFLACELWEIRKQETYLARFKVEFDQIELKDKLRVKCPDLYSVTREGKKIYTWLIYIMNV